MIMLNVASGSIFFSVKYLEEKKIQSNLAMHCKFKIQHLKKGKQKKKIKGTKCAKGPSNSLRDIRAPNWYKCK